ncbi:polysaccharide biosynthesis/export protein [Idiomarina xiamenensis 10-D-4]|uniref:Polysaccharide biosynthesis/export protein n=2 Tax=Idiomarina xiamenensis TaxID=1207041 RepID=K2K6B8_9GAMM|nr:polysaccharide biosynthesis/export protein [Idiomarina xiamenensis 10-D-4]
MPTQEQIEQFKKLPKAQQEQLARQYGVDLSSLQNQSSSTTESNKQSKTVFPRGTTFDEEGNPALPEDIKEQFATDEGDLKPFGYRLFAGEPSTFAPTSDAPVPSNYKIGVGDTINISLYGKEALDLQLTVSSEGNIVIPNLKPIRVAGLSYEDMQSLIKETVRSRMIGQQAAISMGELRSIQIFIVGEAYKPGAYTVSSMTTITQALFVSGGVSDIASLRNIQLKRNGRTIVNFDLYDFLLKGDASNDRILQAGDVVFIPSHGAMVKVRGEVVRPAIYELRGESTVKEVVDLAGGLLPSAYKQAIQIEYLENGSRHAGTIDLTKDNSNAVQGGDTINVPAISSDVSQSIMLVGAVSRPGFYQWREGIKVNNIISNVKRDLLSYADLGYGLIVREIDHGRRLALYQFDVANAIGGREDSNLTLEKNDQLVIFSRYQETAQEKLQLDDWLLTQSEKNKRERTKLLEQYRQNYLRELVPDFTSEKGKGTFAEYSRKRLLEPLLSRLSHQYSESGSLPLVYIEGEVRYPGTYPLTENATASSLIAAAGGLKESAYLARAEITRTVIEDGEANTSYIPFSLFDELMSDDRKQTLRGRDKLNIFSIPQWQNTVEVILEGEVRFPGKYAIRRGETLENLIERAGGLTDYAFPRGAIFTRESLKELERKRLQVLARDLQREIATNSITDSSQATLPYEQTRQLLSDLTSVEPVGRLVIDLPEILSGTRDADLQLKDGDRLVVPSSINTVNIIGEVQMASSYRFDSTLNIADYIKKAGGIKEKADEERIYIVKANGSVSLYEQKGWFSFDGSDQLEPGDTIVVPLDTQYMSNLTLWRDATQILYQLGVAVAALAAI